MPRSQGLVSSLIKKGEVTKKILYGLQITN